MNILSFPNKHLAQSTSKVEFFDSELEKTCQKILQCMSEKYGVGLAANQVGIDKNIFIMHCDKNTPPYIFINPVIEQKSPEYILWKEGCLSFPGLNLEINRHAEITLTWQDMLGSAHTQKFTGLEAVCCQHEVDHLLGITFIERLGSVKKHMALKQYSKNRLY